MRQQWRNLVQLAILAIFAALPAGKSPAADFSKDVFPLLKRACFECHGPQKQEGGLRLDGREGVQKGGDSGLSLVAGKPDESELLRRVQLPAGDEARMPQRGNGLKPAEIETLRHWIAAGAKWPDRIDEPPHWAYVAPVKLPLPRLAGEQSDNAVDAFVRSRLELEGLRPSPQADRATLLRRATLDIIGLPPTPAEVDAFENDKSPNAYERVVDRLLQSPEYGVRWARPWLDAARYADSHGFQRDDLRDLWAYRDWVVDALNADMPFDQFTIEQVAGDLLPEATLAQRIATGFHRCTPTNVEAGTDPEESRINQVFDRVNTTGAIWLGVTLECTQCHDHKYDPFTMKDYYRLVACFNNTEAEADRANPKVPGSIRFLGPSMPLPGEIDQNKKAAVEKQIANTKAAIAKRQEAIKKAGGVVEEIVMDDQEEPKPPADAALAKLVTKQAQLAKALAALKPPETLVMRELPQPRMSTVLNRGLYTSPGEPVEAGTPAALAPLMPGPHNRLTLARWLMAPENPLTARVAVNRVWQEVFGHGIVATAEDFGVKGEPPSHQELLDWLAVDFREQGWSQKTLLRQIVLSQTYRQTSRVTPDLLARDDKNRLLARGPRLRMDAEMIRDNALAVAGLLSLGKGGPSIRAPQPDGLWTKVGGVKNEYVVSPGEQQYRRGIYVVLKRGSPYPSFMNFDASSRMTCVVRRSRSNTPLQALTLLNDPVYVEAAKHLARRVLDENPDGDVDSRLISAFRLALAREPSARETAVLRTLYDAQRDRFSKDEKAIEAVVGKVGNPVELAALHAVASALLNLDETITKN